MKVLPIGDAEFLVLTDDGVQHRVWAVVTEETRWAFCAGQVWATARAGSVPVRRRATAHEMLSAPMPATVLGIQVVEGQPVARGQTVLLLEAMKMELPLRAAHDGVVTAIRCAEGELVQPGVPLIEIE